MEMFEKAKEIRETRYKNCFSRHNRPVRVYILTGILRCGYCGGSMRGVSNATKRYYVDGNQRDKSCHCTQKTIYAEEMEKQFTDWIRSIFESVFYKLKSAQFIIEKVPTLKVATLKLLSKRGPLYY